MAGAVTQSALSEQHNLDLASMPHKMSEFGQAPGSDCFRRPDHWHGRTRTGASCTSTIMFTETFFILMLLVLPDSHPKLSDLCRLPARRA